MAKRLINWLTDRPFAHRGLFVNPSRPENSLAALRWAVDEGYGAEIDVRVLSGGHPVVFHDADLARMTGVPGPIEQRTLAEIAALRLGGTNEPIPTLTQALDLIDGRVPLLIDLKSAHDVQAAARAVWQTIEGGQTQCAVISRHLTHLTWFCKHAPDVARGLVIEFDDERGPNLLGLARRIHRSCRIAEPDFLAFDLLHLTKLRIWLIKRYAPLVVWTVKTPQQWRWAQDNANNFMFELPGKMSLADLNIEKGIERIITDALSPT